MSEFKGTPGPWEIDDYGTLRGTPRDDNDPGPVVMDLVDEHLQMQVAEADAAMIAAGPDLFDALQEQLADRFEEDDHYSAEHLLYRCMECFEIAEDDFKAIAHAPDCSVGRARAAIAKALGEQP